MMFAGLKLGGKERGGNSLNVVDEGEDVVHHAVHAADVVDLPIPEGVGGDVGPFERVLHDVEDLLQAERREWLRPDAHRSFLALLGEHVFVVPFPHRHENAVVVWNRKTCRARS